jgi:predicted transcriptional regulator YdeE
MEQCLTKIHEMNENQLTKERIKTMEMIEQDNVIHIMGIEIRTTNDKGVAFQEIPLHWNTFFEQSIMDKIPNKASGDIYGVYTQFENEGQNNNGTYSFIIGVEVSALEQIPEQFVLTAIPKSSYQVFEVATGHPERVGGKWQEIWEHSFKNKRTFVSDYELYRASGEIEIYIGIE